MKLHTLPTRIIHYPDPRLRRVCEPIEEFSVELAGLAERMLELMRTGNGVGLAGPQVGICRRIIVCNPTGQPADDAVFINPQLSDLTGTIEAEEGCLSLPEIRVRVRRARRCRIKAYDLTGRSIEGQAEDLLSRIWQHEVEHLDGKLIIDRMDTTDRIANKKLIAQLEADYRRVSNKAVR